jgi:D-beta-D-heptose 7-phosphate kinase/D-beta-D-heptose 1-phosphate adenosyltransferase
MTESATTQQQTSFNILLIGDNCKDIYQYGTIDRLSPEAPVPVFVPTHKEERNGMAGNVYNNLKALGCEVSYLHGETSVKTRLIDKRSKQQIVRIDDDIKSTPITLSTDIPSVYDAVVISDYNKGTVSYELMEDVIKQSNHGVKFPVFIDTKKTDLERLQGAWVKINELEYSNIKSECSGLIVTRGAKGASVIHHDIDVPALPVEVSDVTGAGDTFLAAFAYWYVNTKNILQSTKFAIQASSITVQHVGVYSPTLKEME